MASNKWKGFRNWLRHVFSVKTQRQEALLRLSADLAAVMDETEISRRVVSGLHATLGYDYLALFLLDETSGNRILSANVGFDHMVPSLPPGRGLSERPLLDQRLHYTPDVNIEPSYVSGVGGSEVDVPIWIDGKVRGVLVAESRRKSHFDSADFEVLTAAAQQASLALEKARLLARERQRADELDALRATMAEITAELKLSALLKAIVERAADLLAVSGGELGLYNETDQEIEIVVSHNLRKDNVGSRLALGEGAMGRVVKSGQPLIIEDYQEWEAGLPDYPNIHATMAVPLEVGQRIVGVFTSVSTKKERKFTQADLHLLKLFGQQASIAIENARLYEQARVEIAERKKFEKEIVHQKEYFEALFVNNPVAVVTADLEGTIVSWNPSAEKLFQYTQKEVVGKNLDDVVAKNVTIYDEAKGYSREVIDKGRVQAIVKRTRKDGTLVDMELLALPVIVGGQRVGFIAIYVDITDLQNARRTSEAANQAKSIFLANMNHELRTPLNAILGFAQIMEGDANLTPTQQEYLEIINQSGEHLLALINDVLEMSKIEAGQVSLREKPFDLHLMLAGLEDMFRIRAQEKDLVLRFIMEPNLPRFVVSDEGRLRQVLLNLLGNAVKFTQQGEVALRASRGKTDDSAGERVSLVIAIEDSGPGIQEDELRAIFEPFVQTSHANSLHEGTGLGLSISSQLVRLMGGEISVSSKLNQGSIFEFEIKTGLAESTQIPEE
jgi:PAS domain S-box-containing protein